MTQATVSEKRQQCCPPQLQQRPKYDTVLVPNAFVSRAAIQRRERSDDEEKKIGAFSGSYSSGERWVAASLSGNFPSDTLNLRKLLLGREVCDSTQAGPFFKNVYLTIEQRIYQLHMPNRQVAELFAKFQRGASFEPRAFDSWVI